MNGIYCKWQQLIWNKQQKKKKKKKFYFAEQIKITKQSTTEDTQSIKSFFDV